MKIARISKGIFGKSQCNTEMSTVIPINLKRGANSPLFNILHVRPNFTKERKYVVPNFINL